MKRYPIRAAKYVVYLAILFFVIFGFMNALGGTNLPLSTLFTTSRGALLGAALLVFALLYPFFGFVRKSITFDASQRAGDIERVMGMCGYMRSGGTDDKMEFRAVGTMKRLGLMFEDTIQITTLDGFSTLEGPRKEVVKAAYRMGTFVQQ